MRNLIDLFDLVKQSDVTLMGYTFKDERIKDELISNFNYIEIEKIDPSFSFKSFLRNLKLDSILITGKPVKKPEYILLDVGNIFYDSENIGDKQRQIGNALMKIRENMYSKISGVYPQNPFYKLIVTCPMHRSLSQNDDVMNFTGGRQPLYMADLAVVIYSDKIKIVKNRHGNDGDYILHNLKGIEYGKSLETL